MNKEKALKGIKIAVCVLLAAVLLVCGVLFFPLMGKKNTEIWSAGDEFKIENVQSVEKGENFKILLMADTQLWSNPAENKACFEEMDKLVEKTQPDMIVTLGDNLSAFASRFYMKSYIEKMDSYKIPWAPVFGNHDNEIPTNSLNWQGDCYEKSEYCLFKKGPSNLYGCGNYAVNITENGKPVYTLFMFDNGRYIKYEDGSKKEIYMGYEQIAWYEWNVKGIEKATGAVVPSMTFSHFAQPEFREAVEKFGVKTEDGSYTIPAEYGSGSCAYLPCAAPVKSGFFDKCKELGSTKYIFSGHDHESNAKIEYEGITFGYGLKTGPSPSPWNGAKKTGGTLLTIGGDNSVKIEDIVITER